MKAHIELKKVHEGDQIFDRSDVDYIQIIHDSDKLFIYFPDIEIPERNIVQDFLNSHGIEFEEKHTGPGVIAFVIDTAKYKTMSWSDDSTHGFRFNLDEYFAEFTVGEEKIRTSKIPVERK